MAIDLPADLLALEHAAWTEIQNGALTVDTAAAVQAAVTKFAADHGQRRDEVEMGLKKAVRHGATQA